MQERSPEETALLLARRALAADPADAADETRRLLQTVISGGMDSALAALDEFKRAHQREPLDDHRHRVLLSLERMTQPEIASPVPAAWRLPALPTFPLYGLTSAWHGERRLSVWNVVDGSRTEDTINPAAFHNVDLGHGDPLGGIWGRPRVLVRNLPPALLTNTGPYPERWPGELASDVALHALLMLDSAAHVTAPDEADRHGWWSRRVQGHDTQSRNLDAAPWTSASVMVGATPATFRVQFLGNAWAAWAILEDVRLAVSGANFPLPVLSLEQIDIADYYGDDRH